MTEKRSRKDRHMQQDNTNETQREGESQAVSAAESETHANGVCVGTSAAEQGNDTATARKEVNRSGVKKAPREVFYALVAFTSGADVPDVVSVAATRMRAEKLRDSMRLILARNYSRCEIWKCRKA